MTEQEKQLLLKDLCARLPYGVKATTTSNGWMGVYIVSGYNNDRIYLDCPVYDEGDDEWLIESIKPYLCPMSSMTRDEACEMFKTIYNHKVTALDIEQDRIRYGCIQDGGYGHIVLLFNKIYSIEQMDWLNANHFDYRGMIEKGLALPAKEGMY